jgi:diguanylate cyclase (GGDEF)-like protein
MSVVVLRSFVSVLAPGGLLVLATAILLYQGFLGKSLAALVHIYPVMVAAAGLFLGWRFNRSRLIFAIIILAVADRSLAHYASGLAANRAAGRTVYNAVAFLLPLNLILFAVLKDRGVFTLRGIARFGLIAAEVLAVMALCWHRHLGVAEWLNASLMPIRSLSRLRLAQPALFAFVAAFLLITARFLWRRGAMESGFLWALVSCFIGLAVARSDGEGRIFCATAGLVLIAALIESSYTMAFRDELTGLPGRRALNEELLRLGNRYTVAMIDVDFFKKFNDEFGHDVGDDALKMVASKLREVGGGGKAFRYGGEEFALVFSGKSLIQVLPHLEALRKEVERTGFTIRSRNRPRKRPERPSASPGSRKRVIVTVSIGFAEHDGGYANPEEVVHAADKALYRAKQAGRNRLSI